MNCLYILLYLSLLARAPPGGRHYQQQQPSLAPPPSRHLVTAYAKKRIEEELT